MVLEGSHRLEGTGVAYLRQCPTAQIEAPRGNIIYFLETLMHAAILVLSEICSVPLWRRGSRYGRAARYCAKPSNPTSI